LNFTKRDDFQNAYYTDFMQNPKSIERPVTFDAGYDDSNETKPVLLKIRLPVGETVYNIPLSWDQWSAIVAYMQWRHLDREVSQ
jgi:hypothetical protein